MPHATPKPIADSIDWTKGDLRELEHTYRTLFALIRRDIFNSAGESYRAGQEEMRERAAKAVEPTGHSDFPGEFDFKHADTIRALPLTDQSNSSDAQS